MAFLAVRLQPPEGNSVSCGRYLPGTPGQWPDLEAIRRPEDQRGGDEQQNAGGQQPLAPRFAPSEEGHETGEPESREQEQRR